MKVSSVVHFAIFGGILSLLPLVFSSSVAKRQSCSSNFKVCDPDGAKTWSLGSINSSWDNLFNDIVEVVSGFSLNTPATTTADPNGPARRDVDQDLVFCCSVVADCLLVPQYLIPMCWVCRYPGAFCFDTKLVKDRFTTNVHFPDGTYGTVVTGVLNTTDGDTINLVYGNYLLRDGQTGNIYTDPSASSEKPVTSTMFMPSPFTSVGQGSAIPATGLGTTGIWSTGSSVIPATTQPPSTGYSISISAPLPGCDRCTANGTVIPGIPQSGTTRSQSTSYFTTAIIQPTPPNRAVQLHMGAARTMLLMALVSTILLHYI